MNTTDQQLLDDYRTHGTDDAFGALVQRYLDLVYSAALRQVRDPALAQDVTQAVFIVLASKGKALQGHPAIGGWLLRTTRFASLKALRTENRRQRIEQEAFQMNLNSDASEPTWDQIAPLLDQAVARLGDKDRNALALRFFENKTFAQVAEALGSTEDAAKKRVTRALERLRAMFVSHKLPIAATSLVTFLAAESVKAAPATVGASVVEQSAASAASLVTVCQDSAWLLAKETMRTLLWNKLQFIGSLTTVVLLAAGTAGVAILTAKDLLPNTPKSALRSLAKGFSSGDGRKFVDGLYLTINDSPALGAQWKPTIEKLVTAQGNVHKASVDRFGTDAVSNALPIWQSVDKMITTLIKSDETVLGQQARFPVTMFGQTMPGLPLMLKTNNQWKLAVDLRFEGGKKIGGSQSNSFRMWFAGNGLHLALEKRAAFDLPKAQQTLQSWTIGLNQLATDIRSGKFSTADNASAACEKTLQQLSD